MKKILFYVIISSLMIGSQLNGDLKYWSIEDFLGFDEVGDCNSEIGDMTSVFAKIKNGQLLIRITFDDMIDRKRNIDNFLNENIGIFLKIFHQNKRVYFNDLSIANIKHFGDVYNFLRTPKYNLFELSIDWPENISLNELRIELQVTNQKSIVDTFNSDIVENRNGGNAAFVHHGNQGLTYSEVFYGQEPLENTGFDEILEVHQETNIPGNFHLSGTLMPAAEWHNPEFNDWLVSGINDGYVSMLTSALGQHIMPFVHNDMNDWSVAIETDMVEYRYGYFPKVAWVPERVWLSPGVYPDAGVIDWLGDNWEQHGVEAVILDDYIHCAGSDNKKIHWMNNGLGINLRIIPIDNDFVGMMHYDADAAKNHISSTGQYGITVYGTDWEVAAEMNEHFDTMFLDNYESVLWYSHDNYPAINIWKLDNAIYNSDFNGTTIDVQNGTYGLLGGFDGYGGSNNSWYNNWAATPSESDFHDPKWNYGTVWNDAFGNLMSSPNNSLSQLGWYTLMINLHETGWHSEGEIAGWEHHYSSHIKNSNVFVEASKWANGDFTETTSCFFSDVDHDGGEELVMHNDKVFAVFEGIGGKINWLYYKDGYGNAYSIVGSDIAYWSETNGDYNEGNNNHVAALSDVSPNQQDAIYDIVINQGQGDIVSATLSQYGVSKTVELRTGDNFLDIIYNFYGDRGYVKSGWSPDLLDLVWSGKSNLQRMWGEYGSYSGQRNSSSGATAAIVLGSGGASHNTQFEGTLVKGDEIYGDGIFSFYLYAGYTSSPYDENGTRVAELDALASEVIDDIGPQLVSAIQISPKTLNLYFSDNLDSESVENINNYNLNGFEVGIESAYLIYGRKVVINLEAEGYGESVSVFGLTDASGNTVDPFNNSIAIDELMVIPHLVGDFNNWETANHDYDLNFNQNGYWEIQLDLLAGQYEYKVIESNDWDENDWPGINQIIILENDSLVFLKANCGFYTGSRNWDEYVTHTNPIIVGDFISEIGGEDWNTNDLTGLMLDTQNNGIYSWEVVVPEGDWEYKVVLNNTWDQDTYGGGANFAISSDGLDATTFFYDFKNNSTYYLQNNSDSMLGDINLDSLINVIDVVTLVNYILGQVTLENNALINADMNNDSNVDVVDIIMIIEIILNS